MPRRTKKVAVYRVKYTSKAFGGREKRTSQWYSRKSLANANATLKKGNKSVYSNVKVEKKMVKP